MTARRTLSLVSFVTLASLAAACGSDSSSGSPTSPSGTTPTLTAPKAESPSDDAQMDTLRPTLTVANGSSSGSGTRTYEFQISDTADFAASSAAVVSPYRVVVNATAVPEGAGGKTSYTPTQDLQPTTRYYWRARVVQGTATSDWTAVQRFKTRLVGYNRPGELYDPLVFGETVGSIIGSTTWVPGAGLMLNDANAYLRYELPQVVSSGEFSMEVMGLHPNASGSKPRIFQLLDSTGKPSSSAYMINAQYRGSPGNPDNCVAFKAVLGSSSVYVEPDLAKRSQSVILMDPGRWYFWQGIWTGTSFRLVVKDGGVNGSVIYDYQMSAPKGNFSPPRLYAYVGSNNNAYVAGDGTYPGMTVRNVWLGNTPRPASLGSALDGR